MCIKRATEWRKLPMSLSELCIDTTLRCGQSFRWRKISDEWTCTLQGRILSLRQDPSHLHYRVTWPEYQDALPTPPSRRVTDELNQDDTEELVRRYFSLNLDLGALYDQWSKSDPNFQKKAPEFKGVRILSQDAWEALICFICSSNNNISRISQMVHKLCNHYGPLIGYIDGEPMHDFPTPESLTGKNVESHLRELGFGYRAKYIANTARVVALEKPSSWLESLRNPRHSGPGLSSSAGSSNPTYKGAHEALLSLTGVGPKVADCVCLMGLGWGESVPVDTHVWQIAQRDYKFGKSKVKTFNKAMYDAVGDHFRTIWGDYAGWAHSVLFTADLREFSNRTGKTQTVEEVEPVRVKSEIQEEVILSGPRKRRSAVDAKARSNTVVENVGERKSIETISLHKRRRTRGSS
ncbi:N-glycosylase/DNA lyase [Metarhizium anisopliae]|nr:N-glycosylase/DNA lyase [Metarhizium anisopliae]